MPNYYNEQGLAQHESTHRTADARHFPGVAFLLHCEEEHFGEVGETTCVTWETDNDGNDYAISVNTY